jgi:hypothetical protein
MNLSARNRLDGTVAKITRGEAIATSWSTWAAPVRARTRVVNGN